MATRAEILLKEALRIANELKQNALALKPELQGIEDRKSEIELALHSADVCHDRLRSFTPFIDGDLQCPLCWIRDSQNVSLINVTGGVDTDIYECKTCGYEIVTPE